MPNLRGASPVGRDDGSLSYAARSISKVSQEMVVGVDVVGGARSVMRLVDRARKWAYKHVRGGRTRPEDRDPPSVASIREVVVAKSRPTVVTGKGCEGCWLVLERERRTNTGEMNSFLTKRERRRSVGCRDVPIWGRGESVTRRSFGRGGGRKEANSWNDEFRGWFS